MGNQNQDLCPVERAGSLDNRFRRILHNPVKMLSPYIKEGMTVLDMGCGPGYFTLDMARLAGEKGKVIGADLQEGMLQIVKNKIRNTVLENRIILHKCQQNKIGLTEAVDFVLMFYMVHEVKDKLSLFNEVFSLLNPGGSVLIVEPPIHVSKAAFKETLNIAEGCGLKLKGRPGMFPDKAALLTRD